MIWPYEELNKEQRRAVEYRDGPLFVFAGPGTGKTRVTTAKVAYLLGEKGYQPEEVVALTFSEKAAKEMEERILELVPDAPGLTVSTFHSFCNGIISENALEMGVNAGAQVITDGLQQSFLMEFLKDAPMEHFRAAASRPTDMAKTFQGAISRFKSENITIDDLEEYLGDLTEGEGEEAAKLRDFAMAYRAYDDFKDRTGVIDFGDMQIMALKLLQERPDVLARYREQIRHLIVDEFQDTDFLQLKMILLLAPEGNVTVVGDDDQSIYRFRGAYQTNVQYFRDHCTDLGRGLETITLKTNYRCAGNIQKTALKLIKNNPDRQDKEIETAKDDGAKVRITTYPTDQDQAVHIARTIEQMGRGGREWSDIAVLVRKKKDARLITDSLKQLGIPVDEVGARDYFRQPVIRAAVAYLRVMDDPERNQTALGHVMMRPVHGIMPGELARFTRYARDRGDADEEGRTLWAALGDIDGFDGEAGAFCSLKEELDRLFRVKGEEGLEPLVRAVLFGRDLFRVEIEKGDVDNTRLLTRLMSLTGEFASVYTDANLSRFLEHIDILTALRLDDETTSSASGMVNVMTIHRAKGKEFPAVFLPAVSARHLPSDFKSYKVDLPAALREGGAEDEDPRELHLRDERRLLYVGLTRGKDEVRVSHCVRYGNRKTDAKRSVFLDEILEEEAGYDTGKLLETLTEDAQEALEIPAGTVEEAIKHRLIAGLERGRWETALKAMAALIRHKGDDAGSLCLPADLDMTAYTEGLNVLMSQPHTDHMVDRKHSPSSLKCYADCPKLYYLQRVLGIPGPPHSFFHLGTVMHDVLEKLAPKLADGESVSLAEASALLDTQWRPSMFNSETDYQNNREEAMEMLELFLRRQEEWNGTPVGVEKWISVDLGGRTIRGKVDRIDDMGDTLSIIDYKTSKRPESKNKLKKNIQMAVYHLGVEALDRPEYDKSVGMVGHWNLRPDKDKPDRPSHVMVELGEEELEATKAEMLRIIEGIERGEFDATPGSSCRYCDYSELCDDYEG